MRMMNGHDPQALHPARTNGRLQSVVSRIQRRMAVNWHAHGRQTWVGVNSNLHLRDSSARGSGR